MHTAVSDNSPELASTDASRSRRDWALPIALCAAAIALWIATLGYSGIFHDASLYTLQALGRLHPELLQNDLYLRFGSQDRFTFFSPLYATLIAWLGLEPAAALLTLLSHLGLFVATAFVARQLLPARWVLLSVALLIAIPSEYGPGSIFHTLEPFITPRLAAEALALAAVAALLAKRYFLVPAFLLAALLLHPLMATAGVAMVIALTVAIPRPRLAAALVAVAAVGLAVAAVAVPSLRTDDAWRLVILDRMGYVFLTEWAVESWTRAFIPAVALTVGVLVMPPSRTRQVAVAAILIGLGGMVLTLYGADLLQLTLVTQSQPWRWLWLTNTLMVLMLPLIFSACWERGHAGRATVFALIALWLFRNDAYSIVLIPMVLGLAALSRTENSMSASARMLYFGAAAAAAFGLVWNIANNVMSAGTVNEAGSLSTPVTFFRSISLDGVMPVAAVALVWMLASGISGRIAKTIVAGATTLICVSLIPLAVKEWTNQRYSQATFDSFASWRARIPVGAEVLYMGNPTDAWILLQRPAYLSVHQTGSALFSRAAALEMERRDLVLTKHFPPAHIMMPETHKVVQGELTLTRACVAGEYQFIVTRLNLEATPVERAPAAALAWRGMSLYQCPAKGERPAG